MGPQGLSVGNGEESDGYFPATRVHDFFHVNADRGRALVQDGELRLVVEQTSHLQTLETNSQQATFKKTKWKNY